MREQSGGLVGSRERHVYFYFLWWMGEGCVYLLERKKQGIALMSPNVEFVVSRRNGDVFHMVKFLTNETLWLFAVYHWISFLSVQKHLAAFSTCTGVAQSIETQRLSFPTRSRSTSNTHSTQLINLNVNSALHKPVSVHDPTYHETTEPTPQTSQQTPA